LETRDTEPYGRNKIARFFVAEVPTGDARLVVNPALGFAEHHEFRWLPPLKARALLPDRLKLILDWALETSGITAN
jgi:bis(5'-nucleosidyl)-tetraphosphatase